MPAAAGTLVELHRWPVKSLGGEPLRSSHLDGRGLGGDRTHALWFAFPGGERPLTVREAPRMLLWGASYPPDAADDALDPAAPPKPTVTAPDGRTFAWDDEALPAALRVDLDKEIALRRDERGQQDLRDTVLITTRASHAALEAEMGQPVDLRRFRTNLHLDLDAPAYAEEGWQGRRLRVGEAELELLHPCLRCVIPTRNPDNAARWAELLRWIVRRHAGMFGINARPLGKARIAVGDPVELI